MASAQHVLRSALPRAHGLFNLVGGVWPYLSMRSFEAVLGPKADRWLVYTVGGLLATIGWTQLRMPATSSGMYAARRLGVGCAGTLLAGPGPVRTPSRTRTDSRGANAPE